MTLQNEGIGYNDLNELLKNPSDLQFIMGKILYICKVRFIIILQFLEIVKVEQPDTYEKEVWQLGEQEKVNLVPKLKELGNVEYNNKNYIKAAELYAKAVGILEQLMLEYEDCPVFFHISRFAFPEKNHMMLNGMNLKNRKIQFSSILHNVNFLKEIIIQL